MLYSRFYSSIAMTITGTSSPASGGEHLISHFLDMLAIRDNRSHDLHGRQVGVASILMAALYERVMRVETPEFHQLPEKIDTEFWGTLSPVVQREYGKKMEKFPMAVSYLTTQRNWLKLKKSITSSLNSPAKLKTCLQKAGGAHRFSDLQDSGQPLAREKFVRTVLCANQMRERFTILDLAFLFGILPGSLEEIIDRWVA